MSSKLKTLQVEIAKHGLDAVVLNPGPTLHYLTGHKFDSHERLFLLGVPKEGELVAVVPQLEEGNWKDAVPEVEKIFLWDDADGPDDAARRALAALGGGGRLGTVGVEPLALRFMEYQHLTRHLEGAEIDSADEVVEALRLYKDRDEADKIRKAAEIAEAALTSVLETVQVGSREREIAALLSSELLRRGGGGISFGPIVLSGPKSALPHGVPDGREIAAGELLLIDFGTSFDGYHCDITRTFAVGATLDEKRREVYEAVLEANRKGCEASRPGATAHQVHTQCQANLEQPRWADFLRHRTGHGLGIDIHEPPSIMRGNDVLLEAGMVYTVEPGLYKEGFGGVRIEDDLWLTEDGHESLTSYPRELQVIGA